MGVIIYFLLDFHRVFLCVQTCSKGSLCNDTRASAVHSVSSRTPLRILLGPKRSSEYISCARNISGISLLFYMKVDLDFLGRFLAFALPEEYRDFFSGRLTSGGFRQSRFRCLGRLRNKVEGLFRPTTPMSISCRNSSIRK